jgi:quercetin dioxygenase-like cupin family protein
MEIKDFITSGIIEIYCMGLSSDEEKKEVEKLASENKEVRDEIASVNEALRLYALAVSKSPSASLKNKIMSAIMSAEKDEKNFQLPPRITLASTINEWLIYISNNNISSPENYGEVHVLDLPGNETQVTYIAWARKGAVVEESHDTEDEYLLMLKGNCAVTIDGKTGYYKEGDVIYIPKNTVHRAESLSDEPMILIGQRVAA